MRNSNQILHGEQSRGEEHFYQADHTPCLVKKIFVTRMLVGNLFAVANFLVCHI